jgi:DNA-binding transcriptional LysR family regulator
VISACLAALDRLVGGSSAPDAGDIELLAALEDELGLRLVGPGVEATPAALRLAGPARTALGAVQAFFDDAEALAREGPTGGQVLGPVRLAAPPGGPARPRVRRRPDAC